jgi:hypothetical protein
MICHSTDADIRYIIVSSMHNHLIIINDLHLNKEVKDIIRKEFLFKTFQGSPARLIRRSLYEYIEELNNNPMK